MNTNLEKIINVEIGKPVNKVDNSQKISGRATYIRDMEIKGMYYAKTLRSIYPRAKIISIQIPELPKEYYVVSKDDIKGKNVVKIIFEDTPVFANEIVNFVGEPILLVVGPERSVVSSILEEIKIEYEVLPFIADLEESLLNSRIKIFGDNNCFGSFQYAKGSIEEAFNTANDIIEDDYSTGYQEHAYLESQGVVASFSNGKIEIYGTMQCPFYVKEAVAYTTGVEEEFVRAIQTTTGGGFGGKEDYPSILACQAATATVKCGKPVILELSREEDMSYTTKRHPSQIKYKTALDENGNIIGMEIDIKLNGGAYAGVSNLVLQKAMYTATGVYNIPNLLVKGSVYASNTVPAGAFRGFGTPQSIFGIELHLEKIAQKNGKLPLEYKRAMMVREGDTTNTGGSFYFPVKLPEIINKIETMSSYSKKYEKNKALSKSVNNISKKGIGISFFTHGCGFTGLGEEHHVKARAGLRKSPDGKVEILASSVDMGQGIATTFCKIVSAVLEIDMSMINYDNPDTNKVPDSGPTVASRSIIIVGRILERCALELKDRWNEEGLVEIYKDYQKPEHIKWDSSKLEGDAYPDYNWGANVVEVEIDRNSYGIKVTKAYSVFDAGTIIDERICRGQVEGGMLQGIGFALGEVMDSSQGKIRQNNLTNYIIPTSMDGTIIENDFIMNPYKEGPFGAKGIGELTIVGIAPAICSAVQNALGIQLNKIPLTPESIMEVLENEEH